MSDVFHLLVYVDNAVTPVKMEVQAADATELVVQIQRVIGIPIVSVCYWDEEFREYVQLKNLAPLANGARSKLWVATSGVKAMPITEEKDPLEYSTIREQVERLTPPEDDMQFTVKEILRIQNHQLEQKFKLRRSQLFDPSQRTVLKFYADTQPPEQAMRDGFRLPSKPGPYGQGIIFSSDISVAHPAETIKFLLCEVAVGRYTTLHNEEDRGATLDVLQHLGYDSVLARTSSHPTLQKLEEYVVYQPNQAIPRYLVTCGLRRGRPTQTTRQGDHCRHHPGEALRLWCLQCNHLVCPFCMFQAHAGHTAKDVEEVADRERDLLMRCDAVLGRTIEQRQRDLGDLEKMKAHYGTVCKDTVQTLGISVNDIRGHLDAQYQELIRQVEKREAMLGQQMTAYIAPLQEELAQLMAKQQQLREALDIARHPRPSAQADFLSRTTNLHNSLNTKPKFDEAPDVVSNAPSIALSVDTTEAITAVRRLHLEDRAPQGASGPSKAHPLGVLALRPESLLHRDDSLDNPESKLRALEAGYIWVVPNASEHFNPDQNRDIFSDPFLMNGQMWELKVSFIPGERAIAVYLHAVRHQKRTNFRVAVFRSNRWYVKSTRNWSEEFKGRGWGIKPYITLSELHEYIQNDTLKWCVVFTGDGLY